MKKLLLTALSITAGLGAFAQLPVSQTQQKKKVVLEEYTGIHCPACPNGHKKSNELKAAYPDDVFVINIHTGGYADPNPGELDFRTTFGPGLQGISGLTGYPAGVINRRNFTGYEQGAAGSLAQGYNSWATTAPVVLAEDSYVNLAGDATINTTSRLMTVDVEAYFSQTGPKNVKLNVALVQNNIEGTQSGSASNPGNVLPNGKYVHNHVLRHLIAGKWGQNIYGTPVGTFIQTGTILQKQYTYTLPADINGVPLKIEDLEVITFMTIEGSSNIINAAHVPITTSISSGIHENSVANSVSIFPNPTTSSSTITFNLTESTSVKMEVINTIGSIVFSNYTETLSAGDQKITFDGTNLPDGIYFVNLTIGDELISKKVSILK